MRELLIQVQANAQKSDQDLARLRIDKWKADSASKQQADASAKSIRRNLTNAVPDLLQRIQASPGSLNANFRLYRNMNALYDTFSALAESAGAFASSDQFQPLSADVYQLDQLRRQIAERVDMLAGANDAELARLRARLGNTTTGTKSGSTKVVVDDDRPAPKKKPKPAPQPAIVPVRRRRTCADLTEFRELFRSWRSLLPQTTELPESPIQTCSGGQRPNRVVEGKVSRIQKLMAEYGLLAGSFED